MTKKVASAVPNNYWWSADSQSRKLVPQTFLLSVRLLDFPYVITLDQEKFKVNLGFVC